jgi:hypothetical protein
VRAVPGPGRQRRTQSCRLRAPRRPGVGRATRQEGPKTGRGAYSTDVEPTLRKIRKIRKIRKTRQTRTRRRGAGREASRPSRVNVARHGRLPITNSLKFTER